MEKWSEKAEEKYLEGISHYNSGPINYRNALNCFHIAYDGGHLEAAYYLGILYLWGEPTILKNCNKAIKYLNIADEAGFARAQLQLGLCYINGLGVEKNEKTALEYFQKAALQCVPEAYMYLCIMYRDGIGTDVDIDKAVEYNNYECSFGVVGADIRKIGLLAKKSKYYTKDT